MAASDYSIKLERIATAAMQAIIQQGEHQKWPTGNSSGNRYHLVTREAIEYAKYLINEIEELEQTTRDE